MITEEYNTKKPLLTIRSSLSQDILTFIKSLKRLNRASAWINEAIIEKYMRENEK